MASTVASYRTRQPGQILTVHSYRPKVKFDAAFIERRFAEHKAWQEQKAAEYASEIVAEVAAALDHVARVRVARENVKRLESTR